MKTNLLILIVFMAISLTHVTASAIYPDSQTATNDVELGVEGISRLCPTGMWDHWTFRDIVYDKESNTVVFVIQLNSWEEEWDETEMTEDEAKKQTEWIVKNIMKGYNELIQSPRIMCDGDFILYLSLGTLLTQMKKDGAALRISLLKPDYNNPTITDIPLSLSANELKHLLND